MKMIRKRTSEEVQRVGVTGGWWDRRRWRQ